MKAKELLAKAQAEIAEEDGKLAVAVIKERLREIRLAKRNLEKMEAQLEDLLEQDAEELNVDLLG